MVGINSNDLTNIFKGSSCSLHKHHNCILSSHHFLSPTKWEKKTYKNSSSAIAFSTWNHCMHFQCLGSNLLSLNYSISIYFSRCSFFCGICVRVIVYSIPGKCRFFSLVFLLYNIVKIVHCVTAALKSNLVTRGKMLEKIETRWWKPVGKFQIMVMTMQKKNIGITRGSNANMKMLFYSLSSTAKFYSTNSFNGKKRENQKIF